MTAKKPLTPDELDLAFALARGREAGLVRDAPKARSEIKVFVIRETITESLIIDGSTFGCAVSVVAFGHWLGSSAAEWFALIFLFIGVLFRASGRAKRMTIAEARTELDRLEKEECS